MLKCVKHIHNPKYYDFIYGLSFVPFIPWSAVYIPLKKIQGFQKHLPRTDPIRTLFALLRIVPVLLHCPHHSVPKIVQNMSTTSITIEFWVHCNCQIICCLFDVCVDQAYELSTSHQANRTNSGPVMDAKLKTRKFNFYLTGIQTWACTASKVTATRFHWTMKEWQSWRWTKVHLYYHRAGNWIL